MGTRLIFGWEMGRLRYRCFFCCFGHDLMVAVVAEICLYISVNKFGSCLKKVGASKTFTKRDAMSATSTVR